MTGARLRSVLGRRRPGRSEPVSVGIAVTRSVAAGVAALVILAVGGLEALQRLATGEAVRDARMLAETEAHAVVQPALTREVVAGEPAAVAAFDELIRTRLLRDPVVRMKLWSADGRILYSDDARLIGSRFAFGAQAREVLRSGGTAAELSDLDDHEHRFDVGYGRLLEVYQRLWTPDGSPLLFELYLRFSSVTADGGRIWRSFAPAFLGALLLQQLLQVPLAWSLARQVRQGQQEREELLTRALHASDVERHRIARDLHDGAVQTLSGVAYALEGISSRSDVPAQQRVLAGAVTDTRQGISELRSLLVEIYPPSLATAGLARALDDLAMLLRSRGVRTVVSVAEDLTLTDAQERLVYRVAQEALRNVMRHAQATSASVTVGPGPRGTRLQVVDDGVGFDAAATDRKSGEHFGLVMTAELAAEADGALHVDSRPGCGTTVTLDLP